MSVISRKPTDPMTIICDLFEVITADQKLTLEVIGKLSFLSHTFDNNDAEAIKLRGQCLDDLVWLVAEAVAASTHPVRPFP